MFPFTTVTVSIALLAATSAPADTNDSSRDLKTRSLNQVEQKSFFDRSHDPKAEAARKAVEAKLSRRLAEVKVVDFPLTEAIDVLRDQTGANIFVNWKSL